MGLLYSAKSPIIINYTLTLADTWYNVAAEMKGVRRWFIKASESTANAFDVDFTSGHSTYLTTSSSGISFDNCDVPPVYARSAVAGTIIEIIYWA